MQGGKSMDENLVTREEFNQMDKRMTRNELKTDNHEKKLDKIEQNTAWILRLIVGGFIYALWQIISSGGI